MNREFLINTNEYSMIISDVLGVHNSHLIDSFDSINELMFDPENTTRDIDDPKKYGHDDNDSKQRNLTHYNLRLMALFLDSSMKVESEKQLVKCSWNNEFFSSRTKTVPIISEKYFAFLVCEFKYLLFDLMSFNMRLDFSRLRKIFLVLIFQHIFMRLESARLFLPSHIYSDCYRLKSGDLRTKLEVESQFNSDFMLSNIGLNTDIDVINVNKTYLV